MRGNASNYWFTATAVAFLLVLHLDVGRAAEEPVGSHAPTTEPVSMRAVEDRLQMLGNLAVVYNRVDDYTPAPDLANLATVDMGSGKSMSILKGKITNDEKFACLDNHHLFEERLSQSDMPTAETGTVVRHVQAFGKDRAEQLTSRKGTDTLGSISVSESLPWDAIDVALGLRKFEEDSYLTGDDLRNMDANSDAKSYFTLTGSDIHGRTHRWTFDPANGYALISYVLLVPPDQSVFVDFTYSQFNNVGGVILPRKIEERRRYRSGGMSFVSQTTDMQITSIKLNDESNTESLYHIVYPTGTIIADFRSGLQFKLTQEESLTDEKLAEKQAEIDARRAEIRRQTKLRLDQINGHKTATEPSTEQSK